MLLATIRAGDWERFAELAEEMNPTIEAVQGAAARRTFNSADQRSRIEAILGMLESAIRECSVRKDQLSPLIDALNRISPNSSQP